MAGYTFSDWINAVAVLLSYDQTITNASNAAPSSSAAFNTAYPRAIEYAEQRIYREVDPLIARQKDSGAATPSSRTFTLPTSKGIYIVLEQVAPIVGGVRQTPLVPISKEGLEALYPSDTPPTTPSIPTWWCPVDQASILVAPPPDTAITLECFGTQRPLPLSASNVITPLTTFLPDLFLVASMIWWSGYQRDFGAESMDPQQAVSWESQYQELLKGVVIERFRQQFQSSGWSSRQPSPVATPPQT